MTYTEVVFLVLLTAFHCNLHTEVVYVLSVMITALNCDLDWVHSIIILLRGGILSNVNSFSLGPIKKVLFSVILTELCCELDWVIIILKRGGILRNINRS